MLKTKLNNEHHYPRVVIAGNHGSAGKTTVATGLCAALTRKGFSVQPYKKGPDFIDPMWLTAASDNRICRNLDFFMLEDYIMQTFQTAALNADISIIEGNKGLHDGLDTEGSNSTAAMARMLHAPVILVIDSRKITRGIAPLLMGYLNFEPDVWVAGVILNRVAGSRHEAKLRAAIERYCNIEVLGSIPRREELEIDERHLGLVPLKEHIGAYFIIDKIADVIEKNVNLEKIVEISRSKPKLPLSNLSEPPYPDKYTTGFNQNKVRIGVAIDRAFTFYYQENLEALREAGAELVPFSPLKDSHLPEVDGLYIGGGFPEMFLKELGENWSLKEEIRTAILNDLPVYAECGGLMYLAKNISWNGQTREMVGGLPCDIEITSRPQGRGYMILRTEFSTHMTEKQIGLLGKSNMKWNLPLGKTIRAHEFHYSRVTHYTEKVLFAYKVDRGYGLDGQQDGLLFHKVLASYAHLHSNAAPWWAPEFVRLINQTRSLPAEINAMV
tara:strand:- start:9269 stop:10762 length:1494 start_codon:yes stop_codon:yes gene_type:complete